MLEVTTAGVASSVARLGIYNADADWQPTTLVVDAGTVAVDSTGVKTITLSPVVTLAPGKYLLALLSNGAPTLRGAFVYSNYVGYSSTLGGSAMTISLSVSQAYGALPDPGTDWTDTVATANPFRYFVFVRVQTP